MLKCKKTWTNRFSLIIIIPKQLYSSFVCKLLLGRRWREELCGQSITSPLPADILLSSATPPRFSCSTCQFYAVKQGSRNYSVVLSGYLSRHNQPGSHFFSTLLISFKRVFVSTSALPGSALAAAPHWGWWYFRKKSSHSSFVRQNWNCCFLASVVGAKKEYLEFGIVVQIYLPFLWQNVCIYSYFSHLCQ